MEGKIKTNWNLRKKSEIRSAEVEMTQLRIKALYGQNKLQKLGNE